jgi:hypothetical protein
MKAKLAIFLLVSCIAGTVVAAKKPAEPARWSQEPSSFLGLSFDSNSVLSLPQCAPGVIGFQQKQLCRETPYAGSYYTIEGKPAIGLTYNYHFAAKLQGSQVEYFSMSGNTNDFEKVSRLFTEKYGQPSSVVAPAVKTKGGASFTNDTLVWDGVKIKIILERLSSDINTFGASILNKPVVESAAKLGADKVKADASKL